MPGRLLVLDIGTSPHRDVPARGTQPRPGASVKARLVPGPAEPLVPRDKDAYHAWRKGLVRTAPSVFFPRVADEVARALREAGIDPAEVTRVAIGFPAKIEEDGTALRVNNLHDEDGPWRDVRVADAWRAAWGRPLEEVRVVDDMVMGALGLARERPALVQDGPVRYVVTGGGFGAIEVHVEDGALRLTPREDGRMPFVPHVAIVEAPDAVAACLLEDDAASAKAVLRNHERLAGPRGLEPQDVVRLAGEGDARARQALARYAEGLGAYAAAALRDGCAGLVLGGPFAPAVHGVYQAAGRGLPDEMRAWAVRHGASEADAARLRVHVHKVADNTQGGADVMRLVAARGGFRLLGPGLHA